MIKTSSPTQALTLLEHGRDRDNIGTGAYSYAEAHPQGGLGGPTGSWGRGLSWSAAHAPCEAWRAARSNKDDFPGQGGRCNHAILLVLQYYLKPDALLTSSM